METENTPEPPQDDDAKLSTNVRPQISRAFTYPRKGIVIEKVSIDNNKLNKSNSIFIYSSIELLRIIEKVSQNRIQAQKTLHLFSIIYQNQFLADYGAYKKTGRRLSSKILNRDYGQKYFSNAWKTLVSVGAINVSGYFNGKSVCRCYSLQEPFNFGEIEGFRMAVSPQHLARLAERSFWFQNPATGKNPFPEWLPKEEQARYSKFKDYLLSVQTRLVLMPDWPDAIAAAPFDRCQGILESVTVLKDGVFYASMGKSGRWFHFHTSCRRELRPYILIDSEPTTEIDLKAAQPTIIASFYPPDSLERAIYLEMVLAGAFYETIAALVRIEFRPGTTDRDDFKEDCLKQVFYDAAPDEYRESYKIRRAFNAKFPELGKMLEAKRKEAGDKLAMQMQKHEAKIVIGGVLTKAIDAGIPVLPVHDSIFCRTKDSEQIEKWLTEAFLDYTNIKPRVKVNHYSPCS